MKKKRLFFLLMVSHMIAAVLGFYLFLWFACAPSKVSPTLASFPETRRDYHSPHSPESVFLQSRNLEIAGKLLLEIQKRGWVLVCAESVSGGNLGVFLSRSRGAGENFAGSAVCYKIEAKKKLLGIPDEAEDSLYDLQTAQDMALGARNLYEISEQKKVKEAESYFGKPLVALSTTGRAVTYAGQWEGGVYVGLLLPGEKISSAYFPHTFINSQGQKDEARTKEEGMLIAAYEAMHYALGKIEEKK